MAKKKSPTAKRNIAVVEQWIEVSRQDGKTVTELYPSNEALLEEALALDPTPDLVYRRIHFHGGVPDEYLWTVPPDPQTRKTGGGCIQRMTFPTWLETIEREKFLPDNRVGPTGRGNIPRPKERGGCDCPVCTANEFLLDELGYMT